MVSRPTFATHVLAPWVLIDALASLIFVPALGAVGYLFADRLEIIAAWFRNIERAIGTLLAMTLLVWLVGRYWGKRKSNPTATPP